MEIWADSTDFEFINMMKKLGVLHGVTTNPSLVASCCYSLEELLVHLLQRQDGPVAAQVVAEKADEMKKQGEELHAFSERIIVKVPVTSEGIQAIHHLTEKSIPVMATAIFAPYQALFAFKAGAHYLAPYVGRIADIGDKPFDTIAYIQNIQKNYQYPGKIIAAGIRSTEHVSQCAKLGVNAITFSRKIYNQISEEHPGTLQALQEFAKDWEKAKESPALF